MRNSLRERNRFAGCDADDPDVYAPKLVERTVGHTKDGREHPVGRLVLALSGRDLLSAIQDPALSSRPTRGVGRRAAWTER